MRLLGFALVIVGVGILLLYGAYVFVVSFVLDPSIDPLVRLAVTVVAIGGILVLGSLIRERFRDLRRESFKEVEE